MQARIASVVSGDLNNCPHFSTQLLTTSAARAGRFLETASLLRLPSPEQPMRARCFASKRVARSCVDGPLRPVLHELFENDALTTFHRRLCVRRGVYFSRRHLPSVPSIHSDFWLKPIQSAPGAATALSRFAPSSNAVIHPSAPAANRARVLAGRAVLLRSPASRAASAATARARRLVESIGAQHRSAHSTIEATDRFGFFVIVSAKASRSVFFGSRRG